MDTTTSRLRQIGCLLAIGIGTFIIDALLVAILWTNGVDYQLYTACPPNEPCYQLLPMPTSYKWLLGAVLAANVTILLYLLARRRGLAGAFAMGAAVPMGYLVTILLP